MNALSKIDPTVVSELRRIPARGSADLYTRLAGLFRTGCADALRDLQVSLEGSAFQPARAICHRLKSSAANVGALGFSRQVGQLERACIAGDIARAGQLLTSLQAAQPALVAQIEAVCQQDFSGMTVSSAVAARR